MAFRRVIATVGQPLEAARARRTGLFEAAAAEEVAAAAAAARDAATAVGTSLVDGDALGPAVQALAREAVEPMPFAYLPSMGALLLAAAALGSHILLVLGKKWSVRFHAW